MNREFVLRDNEIAINRPDGTVVIMNLNAYRELTGENDEVKTLRQKVEAVKAHNKHLEDVIDMQQKEIFNMKKDSEKNSDLYIQKVNELTQEVEALKKQNAKLNKDLYEAKKNNVANEPLKLILWGSVNFPKKTPDFIYITNKGEVFFNGAEIERKYNLAKGSVSAFFNRKQKYLYVRNSDGSYVWDSKMQAVRTVGLVYCFSREIFENGDLNKPIWERYQNAIHAAKKYVKGPDNKAHMCSAK